MAYQNPKPAPAKILRTPAPKLDRQHGGLDYGQANDYQTPASVPPGHAIESVLATNLRQSSDPDDLLGQIVKNGVSGRDDRLPVNAAETDWQRRAVSDDAYAPAHGMAKRGIDSGSPGGVVPEKTGWNPGVPVRTPNLKP
jgi:hypothetical protein